MRILNQKLLGKFCALAGVLTLLTSAGLVATRPVQAASTTIQVFSSNLESDKTAAMSNDKWFFYNDENDTVDNTLGAFRPGPATAPAGAGSVQISVSGQQRRNLATYQFRGTALSTITSLKFSTFNPSAGNGGSANRSGYLNFNVDFDGSDTWQKRLLFIPRITARSSRTLGRSGIPSRVARQSGATLAPYGRARQLPAKHHVPGATF